MAAKRVRILAQSARQALARARRAWSPGQWAGVVVLTGFSGVAAFGLAPDTTLETVPTHSVVRALENPVAVAAEPAPSAELRYWREERVRRGDTIGSILSRLDVDDSEAVAFLRTNAAARPLYQLKPGKALSVETLASGQLAALRFAPNDGEVLVIERRDGRLVASTVPAPIETRWEIATGEIESSLFAAADESGLPESITLQLADIFGGEIDFYRDLVRGDRFSVVYEVRQLNGEAVGAGRIVAAEFTHRGRVARAFRWRDASGGEGYYAEDGTALRKAFLRSPMEFSRVASGFSAARMHPILQFTRAHEGVDYPAPAGTPVRATGSGTVVHAGWRSGFGLVVQLQHRGQHSTVYGHLSRIAPQFKAGSRVSQGDVIGYVGQTGLATGPHLHYEFRIAGVAKNPLTVAIPGGEPLSPASRSAFAAAVEPAMAQLQFARSFGSVRLASAD